MIQGQEKKSLSIEKNDWSSIVYNQKFLNTVLGIKDPFAVSKQLLASCDKKLKQLEQSSPGNFTLQSWVTKYAAPAFTHLQKALYSDLKQKQRKEINLLFFDWRRNTDTRRHVTRAWISCELNANHTQNPSYLQSGTLVDNKIRKVR